VRLQDYTPPLVAILRGLQAHEAPEIAATLFDAGFRILEVPLNRPHALDAIAAIARRAPADALVGGGTMITRGDVDAVAAAGGRLFVAPHCDPAVIRHACDIGMQCLPGVATPSEAFAALAAGAHGLKLFPAEALGLAGLRALRTVLPLEAPVFPVGGVGPSDMAAWVRAGAAGFGIGSALYRPGMRAQELAPVARQFIHAWQESHDS
jgi:2-dehydro-3-deoxyphosphogalactonate aldolase